MFKGKHKEEHIYISDIQKRMFYCAFITAFSAALAQSISSFTDNFIVVTFLGEFETAAVSLSKPFIFILEIPAAGIALGIQTVCAREIGSGKIESVNRLFNEIVTLFAVVMAALTVAAYIFAPEIAVYSGARGNAADLLPYATDYLRGLSFEVFPYVMYCIISPIVVLDNGGKLITIASVCGCVTNLVIDILSVVFGWGLFGIGIGTSATALVIFLVVVTHAADKDKVIHFKPAVPHMRDMSQTFIFSTPAALKSIAHAIQAEIMIILISHTGGVVGLAVLTVFETFFYVIETVSGGITGAVGIMAGIMCGEKNGEELEVVEELGHHYGHRMAMCAISVIAILAVPIAFAMFETTGRYMLIFALGCLALMTPFMDKVHIRISYLQAIGHIREAHILSIFDNFIFLIASAWVLSRPFGVFGVFLAYPVTQFLSLGLSWAVHVKRTGKTHITSEEYLDLDESFFAGPGDVISYPVDSIENCTLASEQVVMFCRGHKLDEKKAMLAGLCTEELTTNVIKHGASQSHIPGASDLRVVIDGSDVIVRLRDDGRPFNLMELTDLIERDKGKEKGTGIRIMLGTASNISYYRTYGMNTTIIRI